MPVSQSSPCYGPALAPALEKILPSVGDFITNATARPIIQEMDLYEAGYKFSSRTFDLFATTFFTKYDNFGFSELVFDQATGGFIFDGIIINTESGRRFVDVRWRRRVADLERQQLGGQPLELSRSLVTSRGTPSLVQRAVDQEPKRGEPDDP